MGVYTYWNCEKCGQVFEIHQEGETLVLKALGQVVEVCPYCGFDLRDEAAERVNVLARERAVDSE